MGEVAHWCSGIDIRVTEKQSGVYLIRNTVNGKVYVGSSVNIAARWGGHRNQLRKGKHTSRHLQAAWNNYGEENFSFVKRRVCSVEDLLRVEQDYIELYCSSDSDCGYNICKRAGRPPDLTGMAKSDETKKRMSEYHRNRPVDHQRKIDEANTGEKNGMFGRKHSPEMIEHYRRMSTGKKHTPETRARMSSNQVGDKNHSFCRKVSEKERLMKSAISARFSAEQVSEMRAMRASGSTWKAIAVRFNSSTSGVARVVKGQRLAYRIQEQGV